MLARTLVAAVAVLALLVPAGMAAPGPARLEVEASRVERCAVPLDPELCPVSYDTRGTLAPGDDEAFVGKYIDSVALRVHGAGGPPLVVPVGAVGVRHPVFRTLNATFPMLDGALPDEVRRHVTLESRGFHPEPGYATWGAFVVVHHGVHVPVLEAHADELSVGVCWNLTLCPWHRSYNQTGWGSDEDELTAFPYHFWTRAWDSDKYVASGVYHGTDCTGSVLQPQTLCGALLEAREAAQPAVALYASLTPRVVMDWQFNRTVLGALPRPHAATEATPPGLAPAPAREAQVDARVPERVALAPAASAAPLPSGEFPGVAAAARPGTGSTLAPAAALAMTRVGGASVLVWAGAGLAALAAFALYHRILRARALEHGTRRKVFDLVLAEPGIRAGTIAARLGFDAKTALHHVRTLERLGYVRALGQGQRRYFAVGAVEPRDAEALAEPLASPAARALYAYLAREGAADMPTIRAALGLAPATVSMCASRLRDAGLLEHRREGRRVVLRVTQPVNVPVALPSAAP